MRAWWMLHGKQQFLSLWKSFGIKSGSVQVKGHLKLYFSLKWTSLIPASVETEKSHRSFIMHRKKCHETDVTWKCDMGGRRTWENSVGNWCFEVLCVLEYFWAFPRPHEALEEESPWWCHFVNFVEIVLLFSIFCSLFIDCYQLDASLCWDSRLYHFVMSRCTAHNSKIWRVHAPGKPQIAGLCISNYTSLLFLAG